MLSRYHSRLFPRKLAAYASAPTVLFTCVIYLSYGELEYGFCFILIFFCFPLFLLFTVYMIPHQRLYPLSDEWNVYGMRILDSDSASTPSLGRRVWTEAQLLTTMLVRYRRRASWAFALCLCYWKKYIYIRHCMRQNRNNIDSSLIKLSIAVKFSLHYPGYITWVIFKWKLCILWTQSAVGCSVQVTMSSTTHEMIPSKRPKIKVTLHWLL